MGVGARVEVMVVVFRAGFCFWFVSFQKLASKVRGVLFFLRLSLSSLSFFFILRSTFFSTRSSPILPSKRELRLTHPLCPRSCSSSASFHTVSRKSNSPPRASSARNCAAGRPLHPEKKEERSKKLDEEHGVVFSSSSRRLFRMRSVRAAFHHSL